MYKILDKQGRRHISAKRADRESLDFALWYLSALLDITPAKASTDAIIIQAQDYGLDECLAAQALNNWLIWILNNSV